MGEKMVFRRYRFFIPYPFYLYCVILCIYLVLCLLLQITGLGLSPSRARSYSILHVRWVYECPKNMAFIMLAHFDEYRCNKCDFIFISPDINMGISFLFSLILFYLYRVDAVRANCVSNIPWICTWLARRRSP